MIQCSLLSGAGLTAMPIPTSRALRKQDVVLCLRRVHPPFHRPCARGKAAPGVFGRGAEARSRRLRRRVFSVPPSEETWLIDLRLALSQAWPCAALSSLADKRQRGQPARLAFGVQVRQQFRLHGVGVRGIVQRLDGSAKAKQADAARAARRQALEHGISPLRRHSPIPGSWAEIGQNVAQMVKYARIVGDCTRTRVRPSWHGLRRNPAQT